MRCLELRLVVVFVQRFHLISREASPDASVKNLLKNLRSDQGIAPYEMPLS